MTAGILLLVRWCRNVLARLERNVEADRLDRLREVEVVVQGAVLRRRVGTEVAPNLSRRRPRPVVLFTVLGRNRCLLCRVWHLETFSEVVQTFMFVIVFMVKGIVFVMIALPIDENGSAVVHTIMGVVRLTLYESLVRIVCRAVLEEVTSLFYSLVFKLYYLAGRVREDEVGSRFKVMAHGLPYSCPLL